MTDFLRYAAFISYSSKDAAFAQRLHKALEGYGIPPSLGTFDLIGGGKKNRIYPVFRDREELSAGNLGERIEAALKASAALVVVCSPNAAESPWVEKEIQFFKSLGRRHRIFAIIAEDAPLTDRAGNDATAASFPPALRGSALDDEDALEPLAADARRGNDGFRNAWLKVVAGLLGINVGALVDRDKRRRRSSAIAAVATALAAVGVLAWAGIQFEVQRQASAILREVLVQGGDSDPERLLIAVATMRPPLPGTIVDPQPSRAFLFESAVPLMAAPREIRQAKSISMPYLWSLPDDINMLIGNRVISRIGYSADDFNSEDLYNSPGCREFSKTHAIAPPDALPPFSHCEVLGSYLSENQELYVMRIVADSYFVIVWSATNDQLIAKIDELNIATYRDPAPGDHLEEELNQRLIGISWSPDGHSAALLYYDAIAIIKINVNGGLITKPSHYIPVPDSNYYYAFSSGDSNWFVVSADFPAFSVSAADDRARPAHVLAGPPVGLLGPPLFSYKNQSVVAILDDGAHFFRVDKGMIRELGVAVREQIFGAKESADGEFFLFARKPGTITVVRADTLEKLVEMRVPAMDRVEYGMEVLWLDGRPFVIGPRSIVPGTGLYEIADPDDVGMDSIIERVCAYVRSHAADSDVAIEQILAQSRERINRLAPLFANALPECVEIEEGSAR